MISVRPGASRLGAHPSPPGTHRSRRDVPLVCRRGRDGWPCLLLSLERRAVVDGCFVVRGIGRARVGEATPVAGRPGPVTELEGQVQRDPGTRGGDRVAHGDRAR
jgi:hypothetical protein